MLPWSGMAARGGQLCRLRVGRSHDSSTGRGSNHVQGPSTNYFRFLPLSACEPAKEVLGNQ